ELKRDFGDELVFGQRVFVRDLAIVEHALYRFVVELWAKESVPHLVDPLAVAKHLMPDVQRRAYRAARVARGRLHEQTSKSCAPLDGGRGQTVESNAPGHTQVLLTGSLAMADGDL